MHKFMRKYHFLLCGGHYVHTYSSLKHKITTNEKIIKIKKYFFSFRNQMNSERSSIRDVCLT